MVLHTHTHTHTHTYTQKHTHTHDRLVLEAEKGRECALIHALKHIASAPESLLRYILSGKHIVSSSGREQGEGGGVGEGMTRKREREKERKRERVALVHSRLLAVVGGWGGGVEGKMASVTVSLSFDQVCCYCLFIV